MTPRVRLLSLSLSMILAAWFAPLESAAWQAEQTLAELRGRVVDGDGAPAPGLTVAVHRVTSEGGAEIARAESGPDGSFTVPLAADDAIYFAAVRYAGRLHVGEPFRGSPMTTSDYLIVVGADETAIVLGGSPAAPPHGDHSRLVWLLIPAVALSFMILSWRRGRIEPRTAQRAALLELAELEERRATDAVSAAEYDAVRAALRARLGLSQRRAECP